MIALHNAVDPFTDYYEAKKKYLKIIPEIIIYYICPGQMLRKLCAWMLQREIHITMVAVWKRYAISLLI